MSHVQHMAHHVFLWYDKALDSFRNTPCRCHITKRVLPSTMHLDPQADTLSLSLTPATGHVPPPR